MTTRIWVKEENKDLNPEIIREIALLENVSWTEKTKLASGHGIVNRFGKPYGKTGFKTAARGVLADPDVVICVPEENTEKEQDTKDPNCPYEQVLDEMKKVIKLKINARKKVMLLKSLVSM